MIKLVIIMLLMFVIAGCGPDRYSFDIATRDGADNICSENNGIKHLIVTRHFPPKIDEGMEGAIDMIKCNDGAIYYNKSDNRYPVKVVTNEN